MSAPIPPYPHMIRNKEGTGWVDKDNRRLKNNGDLWPTRGQRANIEHVIQNQVVVRPVIVKHPTPDQREAHAEALARQSENLRLRLVNTDPPPSPHLGSRPPTAVPIQNVTLSRKDQALARLAKAKEEAAEINAEEEVRAIERDAELLELANAKRKQKMKEPVPKVELPPSPSILGVPHKKQLVSPRRKKPAVNPEGLSQHLREAASHEEHKGQETGIDTGMVIGHSKTTSPFDNTIKVTAPINLYPVSTETLREIAQQIMKFIDEQGEIYYRSVSVKMENRDAKGVNRGNTDIIVTDANGTLTIDGIEDALQKKMERAITVDYQWQVSNVTMFGSTEQ